MRVGKVQECLTRHETKESLDERGHVLDATKTPVYNLEGPLSLRGTNYNTVNMNINSLKINIVRI